MNLAEMIERVQKITEKDPDFDEDEIASLLNRCVLKVAAGMLRPGTTGVTTPLPDLFTIGSIVTGTENNVPMPVTYQRAMCFAANSYGQELQIYDSFQQFAQIWPKLNYVGNVNGVCVQGKTLYYQGIPTTPDTLTLHFYRYPVDMSADTDIPDGIPIEFHEDLLVNFACKEIWTLKEDGIDGNPFNTKKYTDRFDKALLEMDNMLPLYAAPVRFFK